MTTTSDSANEPTYAERKAARWYGGLDRKPRVERVERHPGVTKPVYHEPLHAEANTPPTAMVHERAGRPPWNPGTGLETLTTTTHTVTRWRWVYREWVSESFEFDRERNVLTFVGHYEDHHFWVWHEDGVDHVASPTE